MVDDWLTVGGIKRWIEDYKLPDDTKVYVQMPDNCDLEAENLHDIIKKPWNSDSETRYVRAWGPTLFLKERKKNLYLDIWY